MNNTADPEIPDGRVTQPAAFPTPGGEKHDIPAHTEQRQQAYLVERDYERIVALELAMKCLPVFHIRKNSCQVCPWNREFSNPYLSLSRLLFYELVHVFSR